MVQSQKSVSSRISLRRTPLVTALLCAGLLGAAPLYAATITVNSNQDSTGNALICTLRDAVTAANTNAAVGGCVSGTAGQDTIHFNIPGAGPQAIVLLAPLPAITEPVLINGYSQPGAATNSIVDAYPAGAAIDAQPMIEIDGNGPNAGAAVLTVTAAATGSVISGLSLGNNSGGVALSLQGSTHVYGNFIGVHADGYGFISFVNSGTDIVVTASGSGSIIGATGSPAQRNLIAQNVTIAGANNVTVSGNLFGTDKSGATPLSFALSDGIDISSSGPNIINHNVIAVGPNGAGIALNGASNTTVTSNLIGVVIGGAAVGNSSGVIIYNSAGPASSNVIQSNTIAGNASDGILVWDVTGAGGIGGNRLDFNSIYNNGGLGIDLRASGDGSSTVTPNDNLDADSGPNRLQNFPVISSAQVNALGGIDIAFTLSSTPNSLLSITAYANAACHASGHGEGRYDSGTLSAIATDASGNGNSTFTVQTPLPTGWAAGQVVTLLARDTTTNDTSEFSACATVAAYVGAPNQPPVAMNDSYVTPFNSALTVAPSGVLANDSDPDGNPITAVLASGPSHGTLTQTLNANGGFVYTPTSGYSGTDSFTYYANDGTVNSSATATVSITVNAAIPVTTYTGPTATGAGNATASFTGGGANCGYTKSVFIPLSGGAGSPPAGSAPVGSIFPFGLFDFALANCTPGSTVTMTIAYPQAIAAGTVYWKYGPTAGNVAPHWYTLPATLAGNTATFSITDGGLGDDDLTINGTIVDQGGPGGGAGSAASIPTLSEWGVIVLSGLLALASLGSLRRQRR